MDGHIEPTAGEIVVTSFEYDGGRQVAVYLPPDPPESVVFAGDGQLILQWAACSRRPTDHQR